MVKKKGKSVSFDAMVKFFMQNYDIPTKKDIDKLMAKLDRLELLFQSALPPARKKGGIRKASLELNHAPTTAIDIVNSVVERYKNGVDVPEIQSKTGYDKKKIRNILFRLHKAGKIRRKRRGVYISV